MEHTERIYSTTEVARLLGVLPSRIKAAIANFRLDPPEKDASNRYRWTGRDVERACWYLHRCPARRFLETAAEDGANEGGGR